MNLIDASKLAIIISVSLAAYISSIIFPHSSIEFGHENYIHN